jgi:hypothetical protein
MNSRKIKIALTVGLMNNRADSNALQNIMELMSGFKEDVGNFLGWSMVKKSLLNRSHEQQTYAMRYENCTLNVDLVANSQTRTQVVQGFQLR